MHSHTIRLVTVLPATPEQIYDAWLDSAKHTAMTGSHAMVEPTLYGRHTAGDGYVEGVNLELDRPYRIVQTWRDSAFPRSEPDSRVDILLEEVPEGTRLTLLHTDVPASLADAVEQGWHQYYFAPMKAYFEALRGGRVRGGQRKPASAKPAARRPKASAKRAQANGKKAVGKKKATATKKVARQGAAKKAAKKTAPRKAAGKAKAKSKSTTSKTKR